jgi:hypothetical protein
MSEPASTTSKLYEAAVGFLVSEKSGANAWEQVAEFVHQFYTHQRDAVGDEPERILKMLKHEFRVVEVQVKKDYQVSRLPVAWRSAKSTAIAALKAGVQLMGDDGAMPKSDVGKVLKASKAGVKLPLTPLEKFVNHIDDAATLFLTLSVSDQVAARKHTLIQPWMIAKAA